METPDRDLGGAAHANPGNNPSRGRNALPPGADLRRWLAHLAATDRLAIARTGVALRHELAGIANRLDGVKATFFPEPDGHTVPVVSGIVSSRHWMAEALGVSSDDLLRHFQRAAAHPLANELVTDGPCQEVVHSSDLDLARLLPAPTHNELDSGPYVTAGLIVSRNPKTGAQNVAIVRLQVSGGDRLGAYLLPRHTLAFHDMAEQAGEDLRVAIVIGAGPAELLASQAIAPLDCDELEIAGALIGRPLPVVRCRTSEIRVPAQAEIVLEGRILADERAPEGPFGEFPQYYGARADRHVIAVDCVTHRRDPIFHTIVGGGLEHLLLGCIPREATILQNVQRLFPSVRDVTLARGGVCRYHLYMQMQPRSPGEAKNAMLAAFAAHYDIKQVVAVDPDVNIHDPDEVEWAVATRFDAARDLIHIPGAQGSKLDPSSDNGVGSKLGFDATKPLDADEFTFKRIRVPGQEEIDLDARIDPDARIDDRYRPM